MGRGWIVLIHPDGCCSGLSAHPDSAIALIPLRPSPHSSIAMAVEGEIQKDCCWLGEQDDLPTATRGGWLDVIGRRSDGL